MFEYAQKKEHQPKVSFKDFLTSDPLEEPTPAPKRAGGHIGLGYRHTRPSSSGSILSPFLVSSRRPDSNLRYHPQPLPSYNAQALFQKIQSPSSIKKENITSASLAVSPFLSSKNVTTPKYAKFDTSLLTSPFIVLDTPEVTQRRPEQMPQMQSELRPPTSLLPQSESRESSTLLPNLGSCE